MEELTGSVRKKSSARARLRLHGRVLNVDFPTSTKIMRFCGCQCYLLVQFVEYSLRPIE